MLCPLTLDIMTHPVMTITEFNFERSALSAWMNSPQGNQSCPMTRKPLRPTDIIPNHALEQQIQGWKHINGYNPSEEFRSVSSCDEGEEEEDVSGSLMFAANGDVLVKIAEEAYDQRQKGEERRRQRRHERSSQRHSGQRSTTPAVTSISGRRHKSLKSVFKKWAQTLTNTCTSR